jgi:hypothetical protein
MNCINSLLTLFLLLLQCHTQNSAPLQLSKNAYMASGIIHLILGRYSISLTGFTSAVFQDNFFTTPFVNTIYNIAQVYYSTAEMDAETCSPYYPTPYSILSGIRLMLQTIQTLISQPTCAASSKCPSSIKLPTTTCSCSPIIHSSAPISPSIK